MGRNIRTSAVLLAVSLLGLAMPEYCPMAMAAQPAGSRTASLNRAMAGQNHAEARKLAEAIKTLEQMLADRPDAATAEAADVLAQLYLARGDRAAAKKAVDFGLGFLKY